MSGMPTLAMDSMSLKIRSFMMNVGLQIDPDLTTSQSLVHYFEETFGVEMMAFLEREWVDEQMERDLSHGAFSPLFEKLAEQERSDDE